MCKINCGGGQKSPEIKIVYNTEVKEITGDDFVRKAVFVNNQTGEKRFMKRQRQYIWSVCFAGNKPSTEILKGKLP